MDPEQEVDDTHNATEEELLEVESMPEGYGKEERDAELQALEHDPTLQVEESEEWAGVDDLDEDES